MAGYILSPDGSVVYRVKPITSVSATTFNKALLPAGYTVQTGSSGQISLISPPGPCSMPRQIGCAMHNGMSAARRLERILREIRRRTRVVGAFPDGQSASTSPLPGYATSPARHGRPRDISTSSC
jgi:hypothetical protein